MYQAYSSIRRILVEDSSVSSNVTSNSIRIGFSREVDVFPCIMIHKAGGGSHGLTGYGTSTAGSKDRWEDRTFQLDILSRTSVENVELITDDVTTAMMGSFSGARLTSEAGGFDDSYNAYRSIQTWTGWEIVQD